MKNRKLNIDLAISWAKEQVETGKLVCSSGFFKPFSKAEVSAIKKTLKAAGIIAWPIPKGKKLNAGAFLMKSDDSRLNTASVGGVVGGSWIDQTTDSVVILPFLPVIALA